MCPYERNPSQTNLTSPHLVTRDQRLLFPHEQVMKDLNADIRRTPTFTTPSPLEVAYGAKRLAPHTLIKRLFPVDTEAQDSISEMDNYPLL